jgi:hypothetical protein
MRLEFREELRPTYWDGEPDLVMTAQGRLKGALELRSHGRLRS